MSAAPTAPAPTAATPAEPPRRRRWLVVAIAAIVLLGGGAAAYVFLLAGDPAEAAAEAETAPVVEGAIVEVGTLTTNLAGPGASYARVGLAVVLQEGADAALVTERFPLVKDAAITEIGRHDAAAVSGAEGTERLRAAMTERVRALYPDGEVLRVVLTELLVQ